MAFFSNIGTMLSDMVGRIVLAVIVYFIGKLAIDYAMRLIKKLPRFQKIDSTVQSFTTSFAKTALYVILAISIIAILGVPMASVVTVLASAGLAIGMALQGTLSNIAGGIMILLFKPFKVGDYVSAAGAEGTVRDVTLVYTTFISVDNKRITVPNGSLMNANVINFSSEDLRRVDLAFSCAKGESPAQIQTIMLDAMAADARILQDPAPFARLSGGTNESMDFTVRAWVKGDDYWDVYFDLTQKITEALGANGVEAPAVRVVTR